MVMRLLPPVVVGVVAMAAFLGPGASTAFACTEYGVFWKMATNGQPAYGAINQITLNDHPVSCVADGVPASGHTSRVLFNGLKGNYFEAGYKLYPCGASHCFRAFVEWSLGGSGGQWNGSAGWPCLSAGTSQYWRVEGRSGKPTRYDGYVDCGSGFTFLASFNVYPYTSGYAEGEGFRRAPNVMNETHQALQWRDSSGGWNSSSGVSCRYDTDPSWNGKAISSTRFDVVLNDGVAC
jgi:hypothetical protein